MIVDGKNKNKLENDLPIRKFYSTHEVFGKLVAMNVNFAFSPSEEELNKIVNYSNLLIDVIEQNAELTLKIKEKDKNSLHFKLFYFNLAVFLNAMPLVHNSARDFTVGYLSITEDVFRDLKLVINEKKLKEILE